MIFEEHKKNMGGTGQKALIYCKDNVCAEKIKNKVDRIFRGNPYNAAYSSLIINVHQSNQQMLKLFKNWKAFEEKIYLSEWNIDVYTFIGL